MRAPVQNKRPRGNDGTRAQRTVRVRSRLVVSVAVVSLTVLGAGAPTLFAASADLKDSQHLVTLAQLDQQAISLAHALGDERDGVTGYVASGRPSGKDAALKEPAARVDRQIDELRATAPAGLARDLATVPALRRTALTGKGTALEAQKSYSDVIATLLSVADELADRTPPRAAEATRAPGALGRAVEQASATRGLLLGALSVPAGSTSRVFDPVSGKYVSKENDGDAARTRDALSGAAQQARVREQSALADFDQAAAADARDRFASTVTGPEVEAADGFLTRLTDQPQLSASERRSDPDAVGAALSARIDRMRGAEAALATAQVKQFEQLRDDDVSALEIRIGLIGALLLLAIGVSAATARSLTRPLAVLRRGSARLAEAPETEEPVRFTGRNDEFAQVVRSLNELHTKFVEQHSRVAGLDQDLAKQRGRLARLAAEKDELRLHVRELTAQLERAEGTVKHAFVNLGLRSLGLIERQLTVIEGLEEREQDPDQLGVLFKLDHLATVIRRHGENLLVLAGTEHHHNHPGPVPLVDVMRAAVSEIERYERVVIQALPPHAQVAGFAADDLSHLVAELLENATSFSPPEAQVQLSGWELESGEIMLSVQDEGIGVPPERRAELNRRLADPASYEPGEPGTEAGGLGLHVSALLAHRHGVRIELREQKQGGVAAVVVLPGAILPTTPPVAAPHLVPPAGEAPRFTLPGALAEANSNVLPERTERSGEIMRPAAPDPAPPTGPVEPVESAEPVEPVADAELPLDQPTFEMRLPEPRTEAPGPEHAAPRPAPEAAPAPAATPAPASVPHPEAEPDPVPEGEPAQRLTDKGLPKRTPKVVQAGTGGVQERKGGTDAAEALRRRLGGFQKGATDGRRDVAAELEETDQQADTDTGETVEEVRR
ncbi:nitrate- and nitrite sensing domain-containing protein [Streptomyces sp. SID1034]|uniref:sensor histidine kinase n=1 Tax=Streptomyces sp. SID1034 TaxID=2690248 RepID=UPI0013698AB3|nr:nitrate- and nitrite sensing domain-containing protein [Streptomyces sp. SID1034]MYV95385.1 HAMP domain-containing protein [Streptomyces sp. SID1034]